MIATLATIICLLVVACLFYKGVFLKWGNQRKLEAQLRLDEIERLEMKQWTDDILYTLHHIQNYEQLKMSEDVILDFMTVYSKVDGMIENLCVIQQVYDAAQRRVERNEALVILYN